ncbi:MAG: phosphate-starvation-inducible PsiE family protein [Crocinitomicaceae bacterium]|nr:phosphate-starvation-inducible PsiE family protein [Crocinitomicaceae bacterium]
MKQQSKFDKISLKLFHNFERFIVISLSFIIGIIILIALLRVIVDVSELIINDIDNPDDILFTDYQEIFGKIMTLLISLEFLISVINVIKSHSIKKLLEDVILIAALAIARKMIVYDYEHHEAIETIGMGVLFLCIGAFYFFLKYQPRNKTIHND